MESSCNKVNLLIKCTAKNNTDSVMGEVGKVVESKYGENKK